MSDLISNAEDILSHVKNLEKKLAAKDAKVARLETQMKSYHAITRKLKEETEKLKRALIDSGHHFTCGLIFQEECDCDNPPTIDKLNEREKYKAFYQFVVGWREWDYPEGFCRYTAETLAQEAKARAALPQEEE